MAGATNGFESQYEGLDRSYEFRSRVALNLMLAGGAGLLGLITWLLTL
jgi:hypothetical protein